VLFSIGNLTPLFENAWGSCWKKHEVCSSNWVAAVTYLEIIGIIVGQMLVGVLGDWYGFWHSSHQLHSLTIAGLVADGV
jgi:ABC-type xylose transport system permease subunit